MQDIFNFSLLIKDEKLEHYLLCPEKPKGKYFLSKGFSKETLYSCLISHFKKENFIIERTKEFGISLVLEGKRTCPNHQKINLRCIWHFPNYHENIIFVTIYCIG